MAHGLLLSEIVRTQVRVPQDRRARRPQRGSVCTDVQCWRGKHLWGGERGQRKGEQLIDLTGRSDAARPAVIRCPPPETTAGDDHGSPVVVSRISPVLVRNRWSLELKLKGSPQGDRNDRQLSMTRTALQRPSLNVQSRRGPA